jgi:hypothetical protein
VRSLISSGTPAIPEASRTLGSRLPGERERTCRRIFNALVANSGDSSEWIGDNHAIVTDMLRDDDAGEYFGAGDHFALWVGHDIADGIVTGRMYE